MVNQINPEIRGLNSALKPSLSNSSCKGQFRCWKSVRPHKLNAPSAYHIV